MFTGKRFWIVAGGALAAAILAVVLVVVLRSHPNEPPTVVILTPRAENVIEGTQSDDAFRTVRFDGTVADADGLVVSCEWVFDDGVRRPVSPDALAQERVYAQGGEHWAILSARDDRGGTGEARVSFRLNEAPVAIANPRSVSGEAPLRVEFDARASFDPDGVIIVYEWDFDGDSSPDASGVEVAETFDIPGVHTVAVWAIDDAGARSPAAESRVEVLPVGGMMQPDAIEILDFEECSAVRWTDTQGRHYYHVNVARYPNPYLTWDAMDNSPPLTKSGTFNNPDTAAASEYCLDDGPDKAFALDYDVRTPGSFAGFFLWLNEDHPDLQSLILDHTSYALRIRLRGSPGKIKLELKLPGVGWYYAYQELRGENTWVECSIALDAFSYLEPWPTDRQLEFVLMLENRVLSTEERAGTVVLDDLRFEKSTAAIAVDREETVRGTVWLDVRDPEGDDYGPGAYVYPSHSLFRQETFDIVRFQVSEEGDDVLFTFTMADKIRNPWGAPYSMSVQAFDIYLDTGPGGYRELVFDETLPENVALNPDGTLNARLSGGNGWEYALRLQGWESAIFTTPSGLDATKDTVSASIEVDGDGGIVIGRVPKRVIGEPSDDWRIVAFCFGIDRGNARLVLASPTDWQFGGGDGGHSDPNIIDLIVPPGSTQEDALDYRASSPVELPLIELKGSVSQRETSGGEVREPAVSGASLLARAPLDEILDQIQHRAARYFWTEANHETGLVKDRSTPYSPCSIAAVGFGLTALCLAAEHGWQLSDDPDWHPDQRIYERVLTTLRFLRDQAETEHGFYWHFLDMTTGEPTGPMIEVSSIDTALLMAGVLFAGAYYESTEVEDIVQEVYERVDWPWFTNGEETLCMSWTPEGGFSGSRWDTYSELMILYLLGLGSPTHPLTADSWTAWGHPVRTVDGIEYVYELGGESLFVHLFSHGWIDFRNRHDSYANYFDNSIVAVRANQRFVAERKDEYQAFDDDIWGLTAGDGPDGYHHYGAMDGYTDGTINPYGLVASMPFAPTRVEVGIRALLERYGDRIWGDFGFSSGFNPDEEWYSEQTIGIDQGITLLMIENERTGFVWERFMRIPEIQAAMELAGFVVEPLENGPLTSTYKQAIKAERGERKRATALKATVSLSIDGALADWQEQGALRYIVDESKIVEGALQPEQSLQSTFSALWDMQYLYLAAEVVDERLVRNITPDDVRNLWRTDSIEFYLATQTLDQSAGRALFKLAAIPFDTAGQPQAARHEDGNPGPISLVAPDVKVASARTESGYCIEIAIPWDELGVVPRKGMKLGFSHAVHSADDVSASLGTTARTVMLAWTPVPGVWARPDAWGVLVLQ